MVGGAKKAVSALVSGIKKGGTALLNAGKALGSKIVSGIVELIKSSPGKIKDAVMSVVPGPVKDAVGKLGGFVGLASGGEVSRTGWAVVGERGPELLRLPGGSTVYDHRQTSEAMAARTPLRGAPLQVVIPLTATLDGRVVHQSVVRHERIAAEAA
jgi:SLT domain-containing protein